MSSTVVLPQALPSEFDEGIGAEIAKEEKWRKDLGCFMPCVITDVKFNRAKRNVTVLPLLKDSDSRGYFKRPTIECYVWRPFFHDYVIDFPLKQGDTGWVLASDFGNMLVRQNCRPKPKGQSGYCQPQKESDGETHQFVGGLFIPDRWGEVGDKGVGDILEQKDLDENRLVIQSADASQRISIGHGDVKIYSNSAEVYANTAKIKTEGGITLDGSSVEVAGELSVGNGASGEITGQSVATVVNGIVVSIA